MIRKLARNLLAGVVLVAATTAAAHAHRAWILPSATIVSGDNAWVTFDAAASNNLFFPDHRPMRADTISVTAPDGAVSAVSNPHSGQYRTTFDVKMDQKGTYRIATASSGFSATYKENGENRRWQGSLADYVAQGIDKKTDVRLSASSRRVETFVTSGAPSLDALKPTGKGLELAPVTHPNDLYAGEEATFRMLDGGKPAAGVEVVVIAGGDRYRDGEGAQTLRTDANGEFKVTFASAGMYWLNVETDGEVTLEGQKLRNMSMYAAVLEVLPG